MPALLELDPGVRSDSSLEKEQLFPIREVSRLTGINPVTLRAWERRYGLIQPIRTESGHRLYSLTDIDTVRSVMSWIDRGVAVSKVGKILAKAAPTQVLADIIPDELVQSDYAHWQAQLWATVSDFDVESLERVFGQVFTSYPLTVVFQNILMPLWRQLHQQRAQYGGTSEWLFLDAFLRSRVLQRLVMMRSNQSRKVLVTALDGQCQELELLVAALLIGSSEVGVRVLIQGQPFAELPLVCGKIKPSALVLFSNHAPLPDLPRRLNRLALSLDCSVMLAGELSELAADSLAGSSIGCLGSEGQLMTQRLRQFLAGTLDT